MGDFMSPKRRDVFDRLRRRIELYRRHQSHSTTRSEPYLQRVWDQSRQDTSLLHQRWQESKNKRSSKGTKRPAPDSLATQPQNNPQGSGGQGTAPAPHNQIAKIAKLDNSGEQNSAKNKIDQVYTFEDSDTQVPKSSSCTTSVQQGSSVSSSVVVDINVHNTNEHSINQIKVNFKSTVGPNTSQTVPTSCTSATTQSSTTSATIETSTLCKQEPEDISQQDPTSNSSVSGGSYSDSIGLDDVEEISEILKHIEAEHGRLPDEFINVLRDVEASMSPAAQQGGKEDQDFCGGNGPPKGSPVLPDSINNHNKKKGSAPAIPALPHSQQQSNMFADPLYDPSGGPGSGPAATQHYQGGGQGAAPIMGYSPRPPGVGAGAAPHLLGDTGPAAETLKQMAAQHQSQEQYGPMKHSTMPPAYSDSFDFSRRMPQQYPAYSNANYYQYPQQGSGAGPMHMQGPQASMGPMPHMSTTGATKRLSHYGEPTTVTGVSSSLQQLQNQVQSTFSQGGPHTPGPDSGPPGPQGPHSQVQISQSQHMHIGAGSQRMHVSQTQQMHIQGNPNAQISLAQHQSFKMSPPGTNGGPPTPGQYGMYNKGQGEQGGPGDMAHMAYMNRPPPEYKMPPSGGPNVGYPTNSMGCSNNPLQTMQNMVNQTNQPMQTPQGPNPQGGPPSQMYPNATGPGPHIKPEGPSPHMQVPPASCSPMTSVPSSTPSYMAPQSMANGGPGGPARPAKSTTPTYTSAIMRGQRPPNVNVGPEGLNISQQRSDWSMAGHPRMMGPGGPPPPNQAMQQQAMMAGGPPPHHQMHMGQRGPPGPPMGNMMQYQSGAYTGGATMQGARMHMAQHQSAMHQQHQMSGMAGMRPGHMAGGGPPGMHHMQQVRMQQQQHMAQAMAQHHGAAPGGPMPPPPHSMTNHMAMTQTVSSSVTTTEHHTVAPPGGYPQQHHPNQRNGNATGADFPALDFLDSGQGSGSDFFDSVVQSTTPSDFNFIDDILGGK